MHGYLAITRPVNSVVAGLAGVLGYLIATGTVRPEAAFLIGIVALVTAAGNTINDYCDAEIDAVNRPDRPIPSGAVSRRGALVYAALLFTGGVVIALVTNPLCLAIAVFNSVLLVLYAVRLKGTPFLGNLAVAYLSSSIFLFGGALAGPDGLAANLPVAGVTLLAMLAREVLKDAEDVEGDRAGGARTLPMIIGVPRSVALALGFALAAAVLSMLPVFRWWGLPYLLAIGLLNLAVLLGSAGVRGCTTPACVRDSRVTSTLKKGMFLSLLVFTAAAILC
ncbi:geranylgeranylglycerol-phosphate geranylgeranyltransferase [Methanofollis formosanus]|uniref:Digeranylgeranylglyceryl phosphate synthase n=1 Tax=Methanofollis formosanus TaxID=299308 RepID=A0A8G1EH24_9EURY|nr:geranylgeranylglycerol-phosphate geranylgeranyltransferase [Methanofollis formosanus]QYZ79784.1 geranylgeranylglycerol-phosphate geranylgeranyltransferase [Methanofollis formosanus]